MLVKQISVFLENNKGRLAEVTEILAEKNIDISAISIADTQNFGILRMMVNNPEVAVSVIREAGYPVDITEVIAVEVANRPGGLHRVLEILRKNDINIEYLYSFLRTKSDTAALILFKITDPDKAIDILSQNNIKLLNQEEINSL